MRRVLGVKPFARVFSSLIARQRAEHNVNAFADELGGRIRVTKRSDFLDEFFHLLKTEFLMGHFTAAKTESDFDLHLLAKEVDGMLKFDAKVVRINRRAELDLLH